MGPVTAATMLAEMGEDRGRFPTADVLLAETGTAPVTRSSGRSRSVRFRYAANKPMRHAIDWWTLSVRENDWARTAYDQARPAVNSTTARSAASAPAGPASSGAAGPTTPPTTPTGTGTPCPADLTITTGTSTPRVSVGRINPAPIPVESAGAQGAAKVEPPAEERP